MPSSPNASVLRGNAAAALPSYQPGALTDPSSVSAAPGSAKARVRLDEVYADEVARLRAEAHQDGYGAGYAEGMAAAEAAVEQVRADAERRLAAAHAAWEQQMAATQAALVAACERLDAHAAPVLADLTTAIADGAFTIVEDLLGRELATADNPGQDAVRRALTLCPADAPVVVRLHPDDYARLTGDWLASLPASVSVQPDPSVEPAGAIAQAGPRRVDAQLGAALARVRAVLTP